MDIERFNLDLRLLEHKYNVHDARGRLTQRNVDWKANGDGSYNVYIRGVKLPANAKPNITNVKIYAPANLYDPAGGNRRYFYSNIWMDPNIQVRSRTGKGWNKLPRLYQADVDGFAYLCIHPDTITGRENILHFLATLQVYVKNADPAVW